MHAETQHEILVSTIVKYCSGICESDLSTICTRCITVFGSRYRLFRVLDLRNTLGVIVHSQFEFISGFVCVQAHNIYSGSLHSQTLPTTKGKNLVSFQPPSQASPDFCSLVCVQYDTQKWKNSIKQGRPGNTYHMMWAQDRQNNILDHPLEHSTYDSNIYL